jgi:hypothetical protein
VVAAARRLLTLVYYGMRDGQIRCLAAPSQTCRRPAQHEELSWPAARREVSRFSAPPPPLVARAAS